MHSWEDVKRAVERSEDAQLEYWLAQLEVNEGHLPRTSYLGQRVQPYLEAVGGLVVGIYAAMISLAANYLVFVWLFHVNWDR